MTTDTILTRDDICESVKQYYASHAFKEPNFISFPITSLPLLNRELPNYGPAKLGDTFHLLGCLAVLTNDKELRVGRLDTYDPAA